MNDEGAGKHRFGLNVIKKLEGICKHACDLTGVNHSGFVSFDENQQTGEVIAQYPRKLGLLHRRIRLKGVPAEEELLRSEVPLVVPDVVQATHLGEIRSLLMEFGIKSICIVKVRLHGKVIGSFSFDSIAKTRSFTTRDIDLCRSFAVLASSEIEQAVEDEWVKDFQQATLAINVEQEAPLLEAIIKQAELLFTAQTAGLYLRRPNANGEDSLHLVASSTERLTGKTLCKGEGMAWQLILGKELYLSTSDYDKYAHRADFREGEFGAVLEVPLIRRDERIGVLYVSDKKGTNFDEHDAKHLQQFADSALIAIQHCDLVARMRDISLASAEIFGSTGAESRLVRLTQIAEKAAAILNAEMCGIFFLDSSGMLVLEASSGHRVEARNVGRKFEVKDAPGSGLTGAMAARFIARHASHLSKSPGTKAERRPIDFCGRTLKEDPAVKGGEPDATPGGACHSLLAVPLIKQRANVEHVTGMLRISNKKGADGKPHDMICFDDHDKLILSVFADAAVRALETADMSDIRAEFSKELEQKNTMYLHLLGISHAREANLRELAVYNMKCGILMHNQAVRVRNLRYAIEKKIEQLRGKTNDVLSPAEADAKYLKIISETADEAQSLEEYSKIETVIKRVLVSVARLANILDETDNLFVDITKKPVRSSCRGDEMVELDEDLIRHVFTVFRDNARIYTKGCPRQELITELETDDKWCNIRFADTGIGMSHAIWEEIAEHRNPWTYTQEPPRKGLRSALLAIMAFGGTIDLLKADWEGTTFEIRLPLVKPAVKEKPRE